MFKLVQKITVSAAAAVVAAAGTQAVAQEESTNRVAAQTDWSVFVEEEPKECWGVSSPKETVNTRDGNVVSVRRGDILLFVTFRPGSGSVGEVSFTGGYPFAGDSTVSVEISGEEFLLYPGTTSATSEWAWPARDDDTRILNAMKGGAEATVTAVSSRGTQTRDTFSLMGFTAAMADAETRCTN